MRRSVPDEIWRAFGKHLRGLIKYSGGAFDPEDGLTQGVHPAGVSGGHRQECLCYCETVPVASSSTFTTGFTFRRKLLGSFRPQSM